MLQLDEWMKKKRRAVKNVSVNSNNKRNYFGGNQVIMALLATLLTILFWLILEMENHGKNKNKTRSETSEISYEIEVWTKTSFWKSLGTKRRCGRVYHMDIK